MKKFLISLIIPITFFLIPNSQLPTPAYAHVTGQPPFFTVNDKLSGFYHVPLTSTTINLPLDSSPETYLVDQPLTFKIQASLLPISPSELEETVFKWDFDDGTTGIGLTNSHTYKKSGSYIVTVMANYKDTDPRKIQANLVQVLSNKNYQLPKATVLVNEKEIVDPLLDVVYTDFTSPIAFSAEKSAGSTSLSYQWIVDDTPKDGEKIEHLLSGDREISFVILRATDQNGFFADAWVQLTNTSFVSTNGGKSSPPNPIINFFQQAGNLSTTLAKEGFNFTSNPLLFIAAIVLIFIAGGLHAITPGHGKSLMSVYLLGKKKGKFSDVLLITSSITATHTIAIFILGFIFLALEQTLTINEIIPYFEKISALIVAFLAMNLIRNGYHNWQHAKAHEKDKHHHHDHHHDHVKITSKKDLLLVGISGGILPCIDAFAILALSVGAGKILAGIFLVFIFSLGLASTITLLGYIVIHGKDKLKLEERFGKTAEVYGPIVSGSLILVIALRLILK